jgi:integrase
MLQFQTPRTPSPYQSQTCRSYLSCPDEDLAALLRTCNGASFIDRRDTAIIRVLLDTGVRRAELANADLADLNVAAHELTVLGKGRKPRIVPLSPKTVMALRKYLRARERRPGVNSPALFLSQSATGYGRHNRLSANGIGEMLTRKCRDAGLGHIHPHQLRHTWAHDMLANGAHEQAVERLGGWSPGSKMVKRYGAAMADERARKAARRMARGDRV